jgi:hypothetical protein
MFVPHMAFALVEEGDGCQRDPIYLMYFVGATKYLGHFFETKSDASTLNITVERTVT